MSVKTAQVYDYLDTHPVSGHEGDFESVLGLLHDIYVESNPINSDTVRAGFCGVREILRKLSREDADSLFHAVCSLCLEYERLAFAHGIAIGMHLLTEVNHLP